ncbi:MAG: DUF421 domain-containing protein [Oscillospiraceae bacterium]|nr:DUF421 domain-containing protein [Oscillospiraceae bacterium]
MVILLMRTLLVYCALVLAMRLMGKRQLGELQPSELVSTILISNLASISIEQPELPLAASLLPVFVIASLEVISSGLALSHPRLGQLLAGRAIPVIRNGAIDQEALRSMRLSGGDLLEALRTKDVFDFSDVAYAQVETDGTLTLIKKPEKEPLTREEAGSCATPPAVRLAFAADGQIFPDALAFCGKDPAWLDERLKRENVPLREVLVLIGDAGDEITMVRRNTGKGAQP